MQYGTYTPPRDWTDAYLDRHHMYTRATPPCTSASLRLFVVVLVVVVVVHVCRVLPPLVWRRSPRVIYDMYLEMRCTNYNHGRGCPGSARMVLFSRCYRPGDVFEILYSMVSTDG